MKILVIAALVAALGQQPQTRGYHVTYEKHSPARLDSIVTIQPTELQSAFQQLLKIGVENHLPLGIIVGAEPSICGTPLPFRSGQQTLKELIVDINAILPGYHAALSDGVLDIAPIVLPEGAAKLLNTRLSTFSTGDNPHKLMGSDLWMDIRLILAPDEGVVGGGLSSTMVEKVPGFQVKDKIVNSILNMIADEGSGGVWVLHTSSVKDLLSTRQQPYEIYGYVGQEQHIISDVKCAN